MKLLIISTCLFCLIMHSTNGQTINNPSNKSKIKPNSETVKFKQSVVKIVTNKIDTNLFEGVIIYEETAIWSKPQINGLLLDKLPIFTKVKLTGSKYFDYDILGLMYNVNYNDTTGWIREQYLKLNENSTYFFKLFEQEEKDIPNLLTDIINLNKIEESKYQEAYSNNIVTLFNLKINIDKLVDSLIIKQDNDLKNIKKKKLIEQKKLENEVVLKEFKDSLLSNKIKLEEVYRINYLLILDSIETDIKIRIDKENIIKIRIADSLERVKDSLKIIERENIQREYLEKLQKQKEEQKKRVDNQKRENEEQKKKNEERRNNLILRFGREYGEIIFNGKIRIGMTEEMLIESWGRPQSINKTITKYGTRKQYVYGSRQYIYVGENGEIETIQSSSN